MGAEVGCRVSEHAWSLAGQRVKAADRALPRNFQWLRFLFLKFKLQKFVLKPQTTEVRESSLLFLWVAWDMNTAC
jgi:hypothetical protein